MKIRRRAGKISLSKIVMIDLVNVACYYDWRRQRTSIVASFDMCTTSLLFLMAAKT